MVGISRPEVVGRDGCLVGPQGLVRRFSGLAVLFFLIILFDDGFVKSDKALKVFKSVIPEVVIIFERSCRGREPITL